MSENDERPSRAAWATALAMSLASAAAVWLLVGSDAPLGVVGEWVWNRTPRWPTPAAVLIVAAATVGYVAFCVVGLRIGSTAARLAALLVAGAGLQGALLSLPPAGAGVERWAISLHFAPASGYLTEAAKIDDLGAFLADYRGWLRTKGSFHLGTHPPGLLVVNRLSLDLFEGRPRLARAVVRRTPPPLRQGLRQLGPQTPAAEQATVVLVATATWLAALLTLLPLYGLARLYAPPAGAWAAACVWPTVPAVASFLPTGDCLLPSFAVATVALVATAARRGGAGGFAAAAAAGIVWVAGLWFSLALLAIAPLVVGAVGWETVRNARRPASAVGAAVGLAVGVALALLGHGWLAGENLPAVWRVNLAKHAGFYDAMPRSYGTWVWVNLVELAVALGPALAAVVAVTLLRGGARWREGVWVPVAGWAATVLLLDLSGRNLSEVARLWILLLPFATLAATPLAQSRGGRACWALLLALQVAVAAAALAGVEPLLPFALPAP